MNRVTLTFDNGPDPVVTPQVLELLSSRGVRAHFFVLGKHLATPEGRALAERTVAEGHLLGNHSYTHAVPLGEDPRADAVEAEIVRTAELLDPLSSGEKRFRPFGGGGMIGPHLLSRSAVAHFVEQKYSCVLWNSVPRDWIDQCGWAERALEDCEKDHHAVVVLHDVPNACLEALPAFLDRVLERGYELTLELPPACVPIVRGEIVGDLSSIVAGGLS